MYSTNPWDTDIWNLYFKPGDYAIRIDHKSETSGMTSSLIFTDEPDITAIQKVAEIATQNNQQIPNDLEGYIDSEHNPIVAIPLGTGHEINIAFLDLEKLGMLYKFPEGFSLNKINDKFVMNEKAVEVFCKKTIASLVFSDLKYGSLQNPLIPEEKEINSIVKGAIKLYNIYMAIPNGTLMVTENSLSDSYIEIARKSSDELLWTKQCVTNIMVHDNRLSMKKNRQILSTGDKRILIELNINHSAKNNMPDFKAYFGGPFNLGRRTRVIYQNKEDEVWKKVEYILDSSKTITTPTYSNFVPEHMTKPDANNWHPTKAEFLEVAKNYLK
jgi:hypothetical protein